MSDPINPAHYDGTACAQMGERMSGNSYQVLKYNWRLGKKDDPLIETGKSIWYLDREILIARQGFKPPSVPTDAFFDNLLQGVSPYVSYVAMRLVDWHRTQDSDALYLLRNAIIDKRAEIELKDTGQQTMRI